MIDRNSRNNIDRVFRFALICLIGITVHSCANMAAPSGGDYDFDPPVVVSSNPRQNELNVSRQRIEIVFDELVQVESPMDKVIITPPQRNFPVIRAQNNKVVVEIKDTLIPNTTYTIDFTDAIADNNEKNALENFALSFSTGDVIDTLAVSGKVLTANDLEPVSGIYVGIHNNLSDTAFTNVPFLRISRTNEVGFFSIKGIAPGNYNIFALEDINRDYMYDNPDETIAFRDDTITPTFETAIRYDSIFNLKTFAFDSLKEVSYTRFLPDDLVLRSFKTPFTRQYLQKHERLTDDLLTIYFGAATEMPQIEALDIPVDMSEWSVLEKTIGNDTLKYWLTKPTMVAMDSIKLRVTYMETDTLNQLQLRTDTLNFVNRNRRTEPEKEKKKNKKGEEEEKTVFLTLKTNLAGAFDVYKDIKLEFDYPVEDFEKEKLRLQHNNIQDSAFVDIDYELIADSLNPRKYTIKYNWQHDNEYRLSVDSAAFHAYNGLWNNKLESKFKIKAEDQYGSLKFYLENIPPGMPAFVELLNQSDAPVRQVPVVNDEATFLYLDPGIYYARITLDANNNGKWDPGNYELNIQPEIVYYWDKDEYEIKEFFIMEEDWNITALPLDKQKPLSITKNKPKEESTRRNEMQRRDARNERQNRNNNNRNSGSGYNSNTNSNYNSNTNRNMY